ncbi:hypothetical protein SUNI508_03117 [Seiridium unicorne]|uniref:Uncharacterized protein n=1 Tax=Seiridium unicorne TaxID=138068 RepID=A0ABR2VGX3_9PEZI
MAAAIRAMPGPASSPPASFTSDLLDSARLPRRLFRIHKKQQELLDKADSWAQHLSRQLKPGVSLPTEILENLRNFHRLQNKLATIQDLEIPTEEGRHSVDEDEHFEPASACSGEVESDDGEKAAETDMSWSPSPIRNNRSGLLQARPLSQSLSPSPHPQLDDDVSEQQPFMSQVPARSPLQPTMEAINVQRKPAFNDFPSSSLGADAELEVVAPGALTKEYTAVNKIAELNPTPPSAQIQVPCTFDADSSALEKPCKDLASIHKVQERVRSNPKTVAARLLPLLQATGHASDIPDSQSSVDSTSSIIPATNFARHHRSPVKPLRTQLIKSTVEETPRAARRAAVESSMDELRAWPEPMVAPIHDPSRNRTPEYQPRSPQLGFSSPNIRHSPALANAVSDRRSTPAATSPFMRYCIAYPSYKGSVRDFVSACLCIRKRRLATYQYDDFIRAWLEGYVPYVEGSEEDTLVAIDWYMETAEEIPLLFQAKVVTKANLKSILELHADEVALIRQHGLGNENQAKTLPPISAKPASEGLEQDQDSHSTRSREQDPGNVVTRHGAGTSEDFVVSHTRGQLQHRLTHTSFASEKGTQAGHVEPTPNASGHGGKRRADTDIAQPVPKRTSLGSKPLSEGGEVGRHSVPSGSAIPPATSQSPMSTGSSSKSKKVHRGHKKTLNPKSFRKFLVKRKEMNSDNISIASSAPVSATPASGQKGPGHQRPKDS